ncbi:MAG: energy transducer TonB [Candidatus Adiutrix sp.]|nr:energy transducer TonB [Candidatus Adiutrix sp.]
MSPSSSQYERNIFRAALAAAVFMHLLVIFGLIAAGDASRENKYKPLAILDFAYYDPEGGEPGGGEGEEPSTGPTPGPGEPIAEPEAEESPPEPETSPAEEIPAPEAETSPEPEAEPEPAELPETVTSQAEEAPPQAPPPPAPAAEVKKAKARAKAAREPAAKARSKSDGQAGGGALPGEAKAGGGLGQGRGGVGGGKGIGNPNALNAYASQIRAKLNRLKKYPPAAASRQIGGVVTVNFTVNRQGQVISSRMVRSSGQSILDQEAMALLRRCSPFPAMPKEMTLNSLNLTVPISFNPPRR